MRQYRKTIRTVIIAAAFLLLEPRETHAYLDPGNGSYFIQIVIAAALGGLVAMKSSFSKIKGLFTKLFSRRQNTKD
ncbi:MAG: hypothetical protein V1907_04345 [Candidatus Kerfeldbacteria bacterium]